MKTMHTSHLRAAPDGPGPGRAGRLRRRQPGASPDEQPATTVVVSGQRASLRNAIAAQEKADNIVSVISSDDIGGLPDKNAAEALARLPGVSVQRDQGEGRYISVRGLGPDLNAVTINGALVPSPEAGRRAVALDMLPAGLIRTLEVSKTCCRTMDANSLGGTVEVKTLTASTCRASCCRPTIGASHDEKTARPAPAAAPCGPALPRRQAGRGRRPERGKALVRLRQRGNGRRLSKGKLAGLELRDYLPVRERGALAVNLDYRPEAGKIAFCALHQRIQRR
jgi:hypothetical protein